METNAETCAKPEAEDIRTASTQVQELSLECLAAVGGGCYTPDQKVL